MTERTPEEVLAANRLVPEHYVDEMKGELTEEDCSSIIEAFEYHCTKSDYHQGRMNFHGKMAARLQTAYLNAKNWE